MVSLLEQKDEFLLAFWRSAQCPSRWLSLVERSIRLVSCGLTRRALREVGDARVQAGIPKRRIDGQLCGKATSWCLKRWERSVTIRESACTADFAVNSFLYSTFFSSTLISRLNGLLGIIVKVWTSSRYQLRVPSKPNLSQSIPIRRSHITTHVAMSVQP